MANPKIFISYSHDSRDHKDWVRRLASDLIANGVQTIIDQWDLHPGDDLTAFMIRGITTADRTLVICSDGYLEKADRDGGGVRYERMIVTAELVQNVATKRFIPIIRNQVDSATPDFMGSRRYLDFREDEQYPIVLDQLLREIYGVAEKPELGKNPFSGAPSQPNVVARQLSTTGRLLGGQSVFASAWFNEQSLTGTSGLAQSGLPGFMEVVCALHDALNKSQVELLNAVRAAEITTFGWPIAVLLETEPDYRPRPHSDGIRAEISASPSGSRGPSYDYWALHQSGDFYR